MIFGILKENFTFERRVALTPSGVHSLIALGHTVYVERDAGTLSYFSDEEYRKAGGTIVYSPEEVINRSDVVLKISQPTDAELDHLQHGQTFFSALHLALGKRKTLETLLKKKITAVAHELIENEHGHLPIVQAMSEIAGQLAILAAANYLQAKFGGRGLLLGGLPGVPPAKVVVLGAGTVGQTAIRVALGMGSCVTLLDKDVTRLRNAEEVFQWRVGTALADPMNVEAAVREADAVIGAILLKGEKTPHIVTEAMVKQMKAGAIIVDVSIDQGGCVETSRPTTFDDPVYIKHDVVHYCVPNMPAAVARTATVAWTNSLLPFLTGLAEFDVDGALRSIPGLARGVCTYNGHCTNLVVARVFDVKARALELLLNSSDQLKNL
ncbi:MAG: alanine dehydrogenase [bacterium]